MKYLLKVFESSSEKETSYLPPLGEAYVEFDTEEELIERYKEIVTRYPFLEFKMFEMKEMEFPKDIQEKARKDKKAEYKENLLLNSLLEQVKKDKSIEKQFEHTYHASEAGDISEFDVESFVSSCEKKYKMTTKEFRKWFEEKKMEGTPEQQFWYSCTSRFN